MLKDTVAHITDLLSLYAHVDQANMQVGKIIHFNVNIFLKNWAFYQIHFKQEQWNEPKENWKKAKPHIYM